MALVICPTFNVMLPAGLAVVAVGVVVDVDPLQPIKPVLASSKHASSDKDVRIGWCISSDSHFPNVWYTKQEMLSTEWIDVP